MSSNQTLPTFNFAQSSTPLVFSKTTREVPNVPNILIPPVANPNVPNPLIPPVANPNVPNPLIPLVANPNVPNPLIPAVANPNVPNTPFHRSIAGVIYGVGRFIRHNLSVIPQKLKSVTETIFGI